MTGDLREQKPLAWETMYNFFPPRLIKGAKYFHAFFCKTYLLSKLRRLRTESMTYI